MYCRTVFFGSILHVIIVTMVFITDSDCAILIFYIVVIYDNC